jgi:nitronate monooxygenase
MTEPVSPDCGEVERAMARLAPWRAELGLGPQCVPNRWSEDFAGQLQAVVDAAPPVASFTFSILTRDEIAALHARETFVIGTAKTVAEARAWEAVGADAVCAQGFEAGGHHGAFLSPQADSHVGMLALVPAIKAAVAIPVIAAGGIMDGKAVAAALLLGADAVQMGTGFLLASEATTSAPWRKALRDAGDDPTRLTRAFSGRTARGLQNRFMREMRGVEAEISAYPIQNALTKELRAAATRAGDSGMMSLWAGQGVRAIREGGAANLLCEFWREAQDEIHAISARMGAP